MAVMDAASARRPARITTVPGPRGLPVVGQTLRFMSGDFEYGRELHRTYGQIVKINTFGMDVVSALGPDAIGEVFTNRDRAYANGPGWGRMIGPFFNRGIMLLDFDEHLQHRRILQNAFTRDRLDAYLREMNPTIAAGLKRWQPGEHHLYPEIKQITLDVATRTFIDGALGGEADEVNKAFIDCVRAGTAYVRYPVPGLRWNKGLQGRRVLEKYLSAQLPAKYAGDGEDMFSALCHIRDEDGTGFSEADVINHMIFVLMAAHDTATITLSTMAYYLAKYPEWQDRCRAESMALDSEQLDHDQIDSLASLDLVMKESMRVVTPVPVGVRRTVKQTELLGRTIPENTMVFANMALVHKLEQYWPDPERWDPDRFSEARREDKVHRHAFDPFGGGVHKCIGMFFGGLEVKSAMHQMLRSFRWSVPAGYEMPIDHTSLPKPKDNLPVQLSRL